MFKILRLAAVLLLCAAALAQEVSYTDDFQSYGTQKNPDGWIDSSVGTPKPNASGLYKTWPDPQQSANIVYGTKQSSGKPEGNNPRIGTFSTLTTKSFTGSGRFEYRGRFLRTGADTRIGFAFFSSYPEKDAYYLIGTWGESLTMQAFAFGAGTLTQTTNSAFTPDANRWYRFLIQADDAAGTTRIRARFWPNGTPEPETYSIDAIDSSATRLTQGRIAIWSAVKGDAYVDDLSAKSPVDHTAPVLTFTEGTTTLVPNTTTVLNRDASVNVTATDDLSGIQSLTVTRNGETYTPLTPITSEGLHTIHARAVDHVGNAFEAEVKVLVDKTAPTVTVTVNNQPLTNGRQFAASITPVITVTDSTTPTIIATLDGAVWTGGEITAEGHHTLAITVTDAANWQTTVPPITFTIDKTAPVVRLTENGAPFTAGQKFNRDIAPKIEITDLTTTTTDAKLDGAIWPPNTLITTEGTHVLTVTVTDALLFVTSVPSVPFVLDKTPPVITITNNGQPLPTATTTNVKPQLTIQDATTTKTLATLNNQPFTFGPELTTESRYELTVTVTDDLDWSTTKTVEFFIDRTAPVVTLFEGDNELRGTRCFNRDITPRLVITDTTETTVDAKLNGQLFNFGTSITTEGTHVLTVTVTDKVGLKTELAPVTITIDKTAPKITVTTPQANATVDTPNVIVSGDAYDATKLTINGVDAAITNKQFTTTVALLEGQNTIELIATDCAGNSTTLTLPVQLDTRAPELSLTAPEANACINTANITVEGRANDASLASVKVSVGGTPVEATLSADKRTFTATIAAPAEGRAVLRVEALDATGHLAVATQPLTIDRTRPAIEVIESGAPFTASTINRNVALILRANDPTATITATLDGNAYTSGTAITAEGAHELKVNARDCAGNIADEVIRRFTIDRTAPSITNITPANNSTSASKAAITGTLSENATVVIDGPNTAAAVSGTSFTLNAPLTEGRNDFVLLVTDPAGNQTRVDYGITIDTTAPSIEININGAPVPANAIYTRDVLAEVTASDPRATITATLDGQPFTSGTTITADGAHTITAKAKDAHGNESTTATASFRIDRTAPPVQITTPANNATIDASSVEVRGPTGGDVTSVTVNGVAASLANNTFTASVPLEIGPNLLTAVARDGAGNSSTDSVEVRRGSGGTGLLVTAPVDNMLTNRPAITIAGQVLTPSAARTITINGTQHPVDAAGAFRVTDFAISEGLTTITVTTGASSITVRVTADFTAPQLRLTANGVELADGARFHAAPVLAIDANDANSGQISTKLTVDGEVLSGGSIVLADGAHAVSAVARDLAGNETRVDRTFFIGTATTATGCALSNFDPLDGTHVYGASVRVTGRSGGAAGVTINGVAASVADGSFCADVPLATGRNELTIRCTDAAPSDTPATLIVHRDADPTIAIASPANGTITTNTVTVSGTVGEGVVGGDVNGIAFTITGNTFSVPNVAVAPGLNVITARARTKSGRLALATVRVKALTAAPQLVITSPLAGAETGAASIDVTGTYANIDPSTITINQQTATTSAQSATSGTFAATIPLSAGANTITATARNAANVPASNSVTITQTLGAPSISITAPLDNATAQGSTVHVTGTFTAGGGAELHINGTLAAITGNTFAADVALTNTITPVIARVTAADGKSATDSIRVTRRTDALAVIETFPANDATGIDRGATILVLFNRAVDASASIRVTDANSVAIDGETFVDRDAISFAPHEPLRAGTRYTVAAGTHTFSFTTTNSAPDTAPILDETTTTGCFTAKTITGRVSTPGARVRLDVDGVTMTTTASDSGAFKFTFSFSGQTGYHVVRVRELGADGTLSPERAECFLVNCATPNVLSAALDRATKTLTIQFSKPMDASTLTSSNITTTPPLGGTIAASGSSVTITFASIPNETVTLLVKKSVKDTTGASMTADYTQSFAFADDPALERGKGFVSGAVYDATNGRPLANAKVVIGDVTLITNERGRYARALPEGAFTIEASAPNYTAVWRQVVVPSGSSVIPIDIRLTKRGTTLINGGDTSITRKVELTLTPTSLPSNTTARLTSLGGQSLAGLLPLGWSPHAAAEIAINDSSTPIAIPGAKLTFHVDASAINAATQTLTLAQYDSTRDEWRVVNAVATITDNKTTFDIATSGNYALVYADKANGLAAPPPARAGAALKGVANPCTNAPDVCRLTGRSFTLEPRAVLPSGRAAATLITEGAKPYPSGTAVQAFIDEQLNLADGRVLVDPPFATDLLVYRTLNGDTGIADFHLAPTAQAQSVMLRDGVDRIRIVDYPGRIDRGTLLGSEGGRVPGDDTVTIDVPAGATTEPLHASASAISAPDIASFGTIPGFKIAAAFTLTLQRATEGQPNEAITLTTPELQKPAKATIALQSSILNPQSSILIAEAINTTAYGVTFRVVARMQPAETFEAAGKKLFTTRTINSTELPLDGITRDGRYIVLVSEAPIAYAFGQVRHANGVAVANARVTSGLGVRDITRHDGLFVVPVPAKPAPPFSLVATSPATGDGEPATRNISPDPDTPFDFGVLTLSAQPPVLDNISPANGAELDASNVVIQATFKSALDPTSASALWLTNASTNTRISGTAQLTGSSTIRFTPSAPLQPATRYAVTIGPEVRGANGAPFGKSVTSFFTTRAVPQGNTTIRRERIRITLPDANGKSTISGAAGALPASHRALAVRRGRFFVEAYQATVASDGSFTFDAGHRHASDRITTTDAIDLQVIDPISNAIVAIIELTPFISADNKAFLAPIDRATTFTSADGITVVVPKGAFDVPTMIRVEPATRAAFNGVASFDTDLRLSGAVKLDFHGVARQRLEVDMPAPANADTSRSYYLGYLTDSAAGTRVELVDLVRLASNRFTTIGTDGSVSAQSIKRATSLSQSDIRHHLGGARRSGLYGTVDLTASTGWAYLQGLKAGFDVINEHIASIVVTVFTITENRGAALVPVPAGRTFDIVGIDVSTGLESFRRTYDPIAAGPPVNASPVPSPIDDDLGPYPVYTTPARVEVVDLIEDVRIESIRGLEVELANGTLRVKNVSAHKRWINVINTARTESVSREIEPQLEETFGPAESGERVVIVIEEKDVDPDLPLGVVFNQPIFFDGDPNTYLHQQQLIRLKRGDADVTDQVTFLVDSRGTRIELLLSGALQREQSFTIEVSPKLRAMETDGSAGLRLMQKKTDGEAGAELPAPIRFRFSTRAPGGDLAQTTLANGAIRDFALHGNVAIVSALDGGVQAFDVSNPAGFDRPPIGRIAETANEHWAVAADRHGRIYTAGVTPMLTFVQSYRLEDFLPATPAETREVPASEKVASAIMTWRLGFSSTLPLSTTTTTYTDLPEALPRKMQIAVSDDEVETTLDALAASGTSAPLPGGFLKVTAQLPHDKVMPYQLQRITVENRSLKLRWSADAPRTGNAVISGIIGRPSDKFVIVRNKLTYAVVSLFGYGIGVFDLNAIESNEHIVEANYKKLSEKVVLTRAEQSALESCVANPNGVPCPIRDLAFTPEAAIRPFGGDLMVYALEQNRGLLDVRVTPPQENPNPPPDAIPGRAVPSTGLALGAAPASDHAYHQRLRTLRAAYLDASGGREPRARFTSISPYITYDAEGDRVEYALIAARDFGLLVVRLDGGALGNESLVDVVWIPAGAYSVRVMPDSDVAVVIDGRGRVLLIDLLRIDESQHVDVLPDCLATCPPGELFPTALQSIGAEGEAGEVGADDPRILWKSREGLVKGTLPPLVDGDTGFVFTGDVNEKTMRAVSAIDPRLRAVVDNDTVIHSVVPLGIEQPDGAPVPTAAFRLELVLPGAAAESLEAPALPFALESELVSGAAAPQTLEPLPKAHLRDYGKRPTTFMLARALPNVAGDADLAKLRYQSGFNRFVSPYVVALSDPRASSTYTAWGEATAQQKKDDGCASCNRPSFVTGTNPLELYTAGRTLYAHPDGNAFAGTPYAYLGAQGRIGLRLPTIQADTVRPTRILTAAQNPPTAGGALQATVMLHSGEVIESDVDHDAGGRAGWNVVFDRTYRSRTLGMSPLGTGWDSSTFRRLRRLPNGDVEYRDGGGEQWLFKRNGGGYEAPAGLYVTLHEIDSGWTMRDLKNHIVMFDAYGRIVSESDVFFDGQGGGNLIRYYYDAAGRLRTIVDPVNRSTTLEYDDDGLLKKITDWRDRLVEYRYTNGRLTTVDLPKTKNDTWTQYAHDERLKTYTYETSSGGIFNALLKTIQEPADTQPRVTFHYFDSGDARDMLREERWGTSDNAIATYQYTLGARTIATDATVTDALRQVRKYTFASTPQPVNYSDDRMHLLDITEESIPVWSAASFGQLPNNILQTSHQTTVVNRTTTFEYEADGRVKTITRKTTQGTISKTTLGYQAVGRGFVLTSRKVDPEGVDVPSFTQTFGRNGAFLTNVTADGDTIDAPEARRNALRPTQTDGGVGIETIFRNDGLVAESHTLEPQAPATGEGETSEIRYYEANDSEEHRRGLPRFIAGGDLGTTITYDSADKEERDAPRGVKTIIDYDELRRPVHITMSGPGDITPEEWFGYDKSGRVARHKRRQGDKIVETAYTYDVLGRVTRTELFDGAQSLEATAVEYRLPDRYLRTTLPTGGSITSYVDGLGRATERRADPMHPFATMITDYTRYDADDNVVFVTDGVNASATRYDVAHRAVETLRLDGTRVTTRIDGWGRLRESKDVSTGEKFNADYTPGGKLISTSTNMSSTEFGWDAAGRATSVIIDRGGDEPSTQSIAKFDVAGRLLETRAGESDGNELTREFTSSTFDYAGQDVPSEITSTEDGANATSYSMEHDLLGQPTNVTNAQNSAFEMKSSFDEAGNVTSLTTPERRGTVDYKYDARGLVTDELLPKDASGAKAVNHYDYKPGGVLEKYTDPGDEQTKVTRDGLGRPVLREYPDGSREELHYAGTLLLMYVDRQGRRQQFDYNAKGQLERITGDLVDDQLIYEPTTGRLIGWKSGDTKLEYADFDADGRPQTTRQIRYKSDGTPLDSYTQSHTYNKAGERIRFTMPQSTTMGEGWASTIHEEHDAMGNVTKIHRDGTFLMHAEFRNAGRPKTRRLFLGDSIELLREYGYDDETTGVGRMNEMRVFSRGVLVAGSKVEFEGLQRTKETLLGVANGTTSTSWTYDERGRVTGTLAATKQQNAVPQPGVRGAVTQDMTDADFRTSVLRSDDLATFTPEAGHKIKTIAREGEEPETLRYHKKDGSEGGSQRTEDARFRYEFDERDRLRKVTEKLATPPQTHIQRIVYSYNAMDRMVGRRVEEAAITNGQPPQESDWHLSTRIDPANYALPNDITLVWDPVSDQLVAIFEAGTGEPLRQFLHGGMGLDDIIEVTAAPSTTSTGVTRFYPVRDEAGTGSLQATFTQTGHLSARTIIADAYGEDAATLAGPTVDSITITGTKDAAGQIKSVVIAVHLTEPIDPSSLATAAHLSTVTASGTPVATSTTLPTLANPYTLSWTLSAAEWTTLTSPSTATALSIEITEALRSTTYAPTTPTNPFTHREPLAAITAALTTTPANGTFTTTPHTPASLFTTATTTATDTGRAVVSAEFQALPFADPMTGLVYARNRWYDPSTGSFLSPDPVGYEDSSNLYAFCGGNPVNCSDPDGLRAMTAEDKQRLAMLKARGKKLYDDFTRTGRGSFMQPMRVPVARKWYDTSGVPGGNYETQMISATVTTQAAYELAKRTMVNDIATFQAAVARADADGEILYVPGQGFTTITAGDQRRADRSTMIAAGIFFATDALPMMLSPSAMRGRVSAEPVGRLRTPEGFSAEVPVRIPIVEEWRLPHGNRLDASGPHDVYAIVDATTGQVYHFGETGRGWKTRGAEWQRKLRHEYGLETEVVPLRTGMQGKAAAKQLETRYITTYEKAFGRRPFYINEAGEVITIQKTRH